MAGTPGALTGITISGDFTNSQYLGNYIDCTGLTFTLSFRGTEGVVSGASFVNGVGSYTSFDTGTTTITATPSQFTTAGEQTITFTAAQEWEGNPTATTTKSVNVQAGATTTKNIYVFTADGRKAIWGTIEVQEPSSLTEVTIINPNNSAVFYNIPEGTSIYLDAAGAQPVVACTTKVTGTTVYMSGDGDCEYIYNDGIDHIMVGDYSVNKIDYSFLSARYADGSLTTCVETSYPVVSNEEA